MEIMFATGEQDVPVVPWKDLFDDPTYIQLGISRLFQVKLDGYTKFLELLKITWYNLIY